MYAPSKIVSWFAQNFQSLRASRSKTLAAIVAGAMKMKGSGVLALGRAMDSDAFIKHRIKRVDRFLGNDQLEMEVIFKGLFDALRGTSKTPIVLVDWTDRRAYKQLVFALSKSGRALPFLWVTIKKAELNASTQGLEIEAETQALALLAKLCPRSVRPIFVADRGFGNARWLGEIQKWGWLFVQRLAKNHYVEMAGRIGVLRELGIRRGQRPRDWGWGTLGEQKSGWMRLVTMYAQETEGPWYLVTNIEDMRAKVIVAVYAKRMWIEGMFRDLKNGQHGLGIDLVRLSDAARTTRHFAIIAIAYVLLCAIGSIAERQERHETAKANTVNRRTMNLASTGNVLVDCVLRMSISTTIRQLVRLPT